VTEQEKVRDLIAEARRTALSGNREKALELIRKALALDPDERVITDSILAMEEEGVRKKAPDIVKESAPFMPSERTDPMAIDPKLEKALDLSEQCRREGDNARALAYLKKARQLFPDNSLVEERLSSLSAALQAETLVSVARKRMEKGETAAAVKAARQAFAILPDVSGLEELLADLEGWSGGETEFDGDFTHNVDLEDEDADLMEGSADSVEDLIERIRQLVREDRWEDAAVMVEEGVAEFPENELLETFKVKFKRLGLIG
jgi:tetratricopeptide (TPR) repeat protein